MPNYSFKVNSAAHREEMGDKSKQSFSSGTSLHCIHDIDNVPTESQ